MMAQYKSTLLLFLGTIFTLAAFTPPAKATDTDELTKYFSETGIFQVMIPKDRTSKLMSMYKGNGTSVYNEETIAVIDQRPYKKAVKSFIVKFEQTIGPELTEKEQESLIQRELNIYENHYKQQGGVVRERGELKKMDWKAGEIYMTFEEPTLGLQGMKARILFTDVTKAQQILTGPDHVIRSVKSKEFFDSILLNQGLSSVVDKTKSEWEGRPSPLEIFTAKLPAVSPPYILNEPTFKVKESADYMRFIINDPVRAQVLFYKVYGYRFDDNPSFAESEEFILNQHVAKYLKVPKGLKIVKGFTENETPLITAEYAIPTLKKYPYVDFLKLRCQFAGNYMVVQEIMGSKALVESEFARALASQMDFHPEQAHKAYVLSKKKAVENSQKEPIKEEESAP